jgi:hypothetical protein
VPVASERTAFMSPDFTALAKATAAFLGVEVSGASARAMEVQIRAAAAHAANVGNQAAAKRGLERRAACNPFCMGTSFEELPSSN